MATPDFLRPIPDYIPAGLQVYPNLPDSVSAARHWFANNLGSCLSPMKGWDAELVLSELAGNVVKHTKSGLLVVGTGLSEMNGQSSVLLTVGNKGVLPKSLKVYPPLEMAQRHRGMKLVHDLSADWGITENGTIKAPQIDQSRTEEIVVWCRFPIEQTTILERNFTRE